MADHYETLGVSKDAEQKAIKRAYFRGVRAHPPEKDPSGFRRIREAYETLSDPAARTSYDALEQHGEQLGVELEQGFEHFAEERWREAAASFKRILVLDPNAHAARNQLGLCLIHLEDYGQAIRAYQTLISKAPDVSLYHINLGHARDEKARALEQDSPAAGTKLTDEAKRSFERAIELERHNAAPYLAIAEICLRESRFDEAIGWADKAIGADGKVDFQDFEALFFKCRVYLFEGRLEQVSETATQIRELVPEDLDVRRFVAMRFASFGQLLVEARAFEQAAVFLRAAKQFDEDNEELAAFGDAIDEILGLAEDLEAIEYDDQVLPPVRAMVAFLLAARLGEDEVKAERLWQQAIESFPHLPQHELLASFKRLKTRCPTFYKLQKSLVDEVIKGTQKTASAIMQCRRACNDDLVGGAPGMLSALLGNAAQGYYAGSDAEFDAELQQVLRAFDICSQEDSRRGMARLRRRYPEVRGVAPELFDRIDTLLQGGPSYAHHQSAQDPACLAGDQMVMLADGRELPLSLIKAGDLVLSIDRRDGSVCERRVRKVQAHGERETVSFCVGGRWVRCTPDHLLLSGRHLVRALDILPGDTVSVYVGAGQCGTAAAQATRVCPAAPVYSLYVEGTSTFLAASVGVHSFAVLPLLRESIERVRFALVHSIRRMRRSRSSDAAMKGLEPRPRELLSKGYRL